MFLKLENIVAIRNRGKKAKPRPKAVQLPTEPPGLIIKHPIYGRGVAVEALVSDSEKIRCRFSIGDVMLKGHAVRAIATKKDASC